MDRAGGQFLSGAALARDDHGRIAVAEAGNQVIDFPHRFARTHEIAETGSPLQLRGEPVRFPAQIDLLLCRLQDHLQFGIIDRLGDKILRSLLHCVDRQIDAGLSRHENDRPIRIACFKIAEQIHSRNLRHYDIRNHYVRIVRLCHLFPLNSVLGEADVESPFL